MHPEEIQARKERISRNAFRNHIRNTYSLSLEEYDRILEEQEGTCGLCRKPPVLGRKLVVDHDHVTGKIRGLLHSNCNTGIGLFEDDPQLLAAAISYLNRFKEI